MSYLTTTGKRVVHPSRFLGKPSIEWTQKDGDLVAKYAKVYDELVYAEELLKKVQNEIKVLLAENRLLKMSLIEFDDFK